MDKATRERLEAAGFRVGDAENFLGLTDDERELVELRLKAEKFEFLRVSKEDADSGRTGRLRNVK